jgi:hypothetical protein
MNSIHIGRIDVGMFFTIYFDAYEVLVHEFGGRGMFEDLSLHHMTPMTGAVSDGNDNQLVLFLGLTPRLVTPRPPMHWIVRVLAQV